jgi:L-alanine-DL-glutamate epimerase-like enolase superfamily enzyme
LSIVESGFEGFGEVVTGYVSGQMLSLEDAVSQTENLISLLKSRNRLNFQKIVSVIRESMVSPSVKCGFDCATWDLFGKKKNVPIWKGLSQTGKALPATSITIGKSSSTQALNIWNEWVSHLNHRWKQNKTPPVIKVKVGSPSHMEEDLNLLMILRRSLPKRTIINVDANGSWNEHSILKYRRDLWNLKLGYIEQPLSKEDITSLPTLRSKIKIPFYLDESISSIQDLKALIRDKNVSEGFDGINIKISKVGGFSIALSLIRCALSSNKKILLGSISESIIGNAPMVHLGDFCHHADLDSHLVLPENTSHRIRFEDGMIFKPSPDPGFGIVTLETDPKVRW